MGRDLLKDMNCKKIEENKNHNNHFFLVCVICIFVFKILVRSEGNKALHYLFTWYLNLNKSTLITISSRIIATDVAGLLETHFPGFRYKIWYRFRENLSLSITCYHLVEVSRSLVEEVNRSTQAYANTNLRNNTQ